MASGGFVSAEEVARRNAALDHDAPAVLIDLDWREEGVGETPGKRFVYARSSLNKYLRFVRLMGLLAYIALPYEQPGSYPPNIVGLFLTGGRDLHPRFYGQAVNGTNITPVMETRYPLAMREYEWARGRLPVLGICWGSQFMLVAAGGSLVQHLPNAADHQRVYNLLRVEPGSWLQEAVGSSRMVSYCNHHQGYGPMPAKFRVTAWDAEGMPHAFEAADGAAEFGFLGHPERLLSDPHTRRMAVAFGELCRTFRAPKSGSAEEDEADGND